MLKDVVLIASGYRKYPKSPTIIEIHHRQNLLNSGLWAEEEPLADVLNVMCRLRFY
jgi:hypothetical protein